jgi:hypothetical protein
MHTSLFNASVGAAEPVVVRFLLLLQAGYQRPFLVRPERVTYGELPDPLANLCTYIVMFPVRILCELAVDVGQDVEYTSTCIESIRCPPNRWTPV